MSVHADETQGLEGAISAVPSGRKIQTGIVRVNLIPAEIAEAKAVRLTIFAVAGAAVVTLGIIGALYHQQSSAVGSAQSQFASAQSTHTQLTAEQGRLGNVDALYAKVDAAKAMLATAEAPQVQWSSYLEDLRMQLPEHAWLTTITATESGAAAATGAAVSTPATGAAVSTPATGAATTPGAVTAATAPVIGTLSFSGSSYTHSDVADLLDRLNGLRGVTNPYLSSSTEALVGTGTTAVPTVNWTATASLNGQALVSSYTSAAGNVTP